MDKMIKEAINVLKENDRGGYTVPTSRLYPFQWNWDSGFTALGLWHINKWRAWLEIISLLDAQWENGMIPHIVFRQNDPDYYPGPDIWLSNNEPPTSCLSQPPVLASVVLQMVEKGTPYDSRKAREIFPRLMASHRWFMESRDPENSGVIATVHPWETGRDNCPDWDIGLNNIKIPKNLEQYFRKDTSYVDKLERPTDDHYDRFMTILKYGRDCNWDNVKMHNEGPFLAIDPGVNFILLRANKDLYKLANYLGYTENINEIKNWIKILEQGCQKMWNKDINAFTSFDKRTNTYCDAITNASFLCFYAGVGSNKQKSYMIDHCNRILNNCNYGMPSLDPMHKCFESKRYWRGPIWSIMNYMIAVGLEDINELKLANKIKNDTIQLVKKNGMAEYFDPITGIGLGGRDFSWTAAIHLELLKDEIDINSKHNFVNNKNVIN